MSTEAVIAGLAFLLGGTVKGVIGVGLPVVGVPILATVLPPAEAIALISLPVLVSNVYQALEGGRFRGMFRRFGTLYGGLVAGMLAGAHLLVQVDPRLATGLLGATVAVYAATTLVAPRFAVPARAEGWASPAAGLASGVIGGVTSFWGPPLVMYLSALRPPAEVFIGSMAIGNVLAILVLSGQLAAHRILDGPTLVASALGVVPTMVGVLAGTWLRPRVPPELFRKALMAFLLVMGVNLLRRALW